MRAIVIVLALGACGPSVAELRGPVSRDIARATKIDAATEAQIDELVASIKEHGVKAVFVESSMSPKLAQTIAQEAGVTVVDEESLFADSLGAPGSGAETYIDATIHNTRVILEAWGVTPDDVPLAVQ